MDTPSLSGALQTHIRATPRIPLCKGELGASDTRMAHAQTYTQHEKYAATLSTFLHTVNARSQLRAGEPRGATKAAGRARAGRLSRPKIAAALLRHLSRPARRLAAPGRLAATRGSNGSSGEKHLDVEK